MGKSELADPDRYPKNGRDYSAWLDDVFAALDLRSADMVSGSMGGWIAMNHAIYAPHDVGELVLLGPMGLPPWRATLAVFGPFMSQRLRPTRDQARARSSPDHWVRASESTPSSGRGCGSWATPRPASAQPFHIPGRRLRKISAPTLVFLGGKDGLVGHANAAARRARRNIHGCEIEVLPDAGHIMSVDEPDFVGDRIVEFLETPVSGWASGHGRSPTSVTDRDSQAT